MLKTTTWEGTLFFVLKPITPRNCTIFEVQNILHQQIQQISSLRSSKVQQTLNHMCTPSSPNLTLQWGYTLAGTTNPLSFITWPRHRVETWYVVKDLQFIQRACGSHRTVSLWLQSVRARGDPKISTAWTIAQMPTDLPTEHHWAKQCSPFCIKRRGVLNAGVHFCCFL